MSITFSKYDDKDESTAGYFRIGCVTLQIPPEDIVTGHVANNDKTGTLRGQAEMHVKTGQARWDVTVRWTALKGEPSAADYLRQWEDLTDIVAMFKAAPFVEIESPHLRQIFAPLSNERMAVALRQLRVDTHPDIVDGLIVTLTMTLFNYHPYSIDFGYLGPKDQSDDAYRSDQFRAYLKAWKRKNMQDLPETPDWRTVMPGLLRLKWRQYLPVANGEQAPELGPEITLPPQGQSAPEVGAPQPPVSVGPGTVRTGTLPAHVEKLIRGFARKYGYPVELALAQALQESGGRFDAVSSKGAVGVFQLMPGTARDLGVTDRTNLEQNIDAGIRYMIQQKEATGSWELALAAYNGGLKWVRHYGGIPPFRETQQYVANIMATAKTRFGWNGTSSVRTSTPQENIQRALDPKIQQAATDAVAAQRKVDADAMFSAWKNGFVDKGWQFDHRTDQTAFFYKERTLGMAPADVLLPGAVPNIVPTQVSVLFVNNLAQIPLAGYQYPTYQHVGPCSSLVSICFESKGDRVTDESEPVHVGVMGLTTMAHTLEEQYRKLRTTFRQVESVHRMQAVFVENDVLNMLGIGGLMIDQLTTNTVNDATDLIIANLTASQYENVFEDIGPYQKGGDKSQHGAYRDLGLTGLMDTPGQYFVNYNKEYRDKARENLGPVIQGTTSARQQFNATDTGNRGSSVYAIAANNGMPSDADEIMQMAHIPGYTMAEAFPTFKLFFMEEGGLGVFRQFDNFYSYASVTDIEIIKPKDKPWTMVLQMTNLAHLLNHKLFSDNMAGRLEFEYNKWGVRSQIGPQGQTVGGPDGGIATGGKAPGVDPYAEYNAAGKSSQIPLKYFPLQTGTKIQLRIGYSNDPDRLVPVFGGIVTEIVGDDVITITCQSFLLELAQGAAENVPRNTWWHVGSMLESAANVIPILNKIIPGQVTRGPAFGGVHFLGNDGDAMTVMGALLRDAKAKHFGHWQMKTGKDVQDFFVKGYDWAVVVGEALSGVGATRVGGWLEQSGNRAAENILINHEIGADGTARGRGSTFGEAGGWNPIRPYAYYLDSKSTWSIWELIRDVARRYPEYILAEKLYGVPEGCDATLVFGHPFDWYYARANTDDARQALRAADKDNRLFQAWWGAVGKARLAEALRAVAWKDWSFLNWGAGDSGTTPEALERYLMNVLRAHGQFLALPGEGTFETVFNRAMEIIHRGVDALTPGSQEDVLRTIGGELRNVLRDYEKYVALHSQGLENVIRVKPIRRYHLVDHNTIIHNGMVVNDKIYNAVRIGDGESNGKVVTIKANAAIPDQHVRTLDVTELINDPKQNVIDPSRIVFTLGTNSGLTMAYAQSFLREEVGKMYRGEIVLRGVPEIEPWDVLMLLDPSTSIVGSVEVDQVIHSFNLEQGYITIVKPRAVIGVNEAASAQFLGALMNTMAVTLPSILRLKDLSLLAATNLGVKVGVPAGLGAAATWYVGSGKALAATVGGMNALASGAVSAGVAAETGLGAVGMAGAGSAVAGAAVTTGATVETVAGATAAGGAAAGGAVAGFFATPPGWIAAAVLAAGAATLGIVYWTDVNSGNNPLVVVPVIRFNRPWVGGLQGWRITDAVGILNGRAHQWWADNVAPIWDTVKLAVTGK